ncbi:DNA-processing protein DprA [Corallincola platygyrae]|uniref:DNA-processing protein DprA n=1 Tax=Corallincola platygyrae TaxID=1193278 RepID=A0ABW4XP08_9GAMM
MRQPISNVERWLVLSQLPRFGGRRAAKLISEYSIEQLFQVPASALPISDSQRRVFTQPDWRLIDSALAWAEQFACHLVSLSCESYPPLLREIPDPPMLLFVGGNKTLLSSPQLAVVGSRNASPAQHANTEAIVKPIAEAGMCITSGLARGIDGVAHKAALAAGGKTLAVMATGPDRIYPSAHRELAHRIVDQGGALVTEFHPGTAPYRGNFPKRNRIVSGMSLGTLVVAAGMKSGSLITARLATEQGRDVFAIPGAMSDPNVEGCHYLIKNGAKLVTSPVDIVEEVMAGHVMPAEEVKQTKLPTRGLLDSVGDEATSIDQIVDRSGQPINTVMQQLVLLEIQGEVAVVPGGYQRVRRTGYV